jgi:hypothetical protein
MMENEAAQSGEYPTEAVPNNEAEHRCRNDAPRKGNKHVIATCLALSILCVMLNTVSALVYFSSITIFWWLRDLLVVILLGELGLYFLWGMAVESRISKRIFLTALCRPLRRIALFLMHVTAPYAQEEGILLVVLDLSAPSSKAQPPASEVQ